MRNASRSSKPSRARTPINLLFTKTPPLGGAVAEQEVDLANYYIELDDEKHLDSIRENIPGLFIFIGPKGVGKSAVQRMVEERKTSFDAKIISIKPEDIALWTLAKSTQLADDIYSGLNSQWLNKLLWNYLFILEILRQEYGDTPTLWSKLASVFKSDMSRVRRLIESGIRDSADPSLSSRFIQVIEEIKLSGKVGAIEAATELKLREPATKQQSGNILNDLSTVTSKLKNILDHNYIILLDDLDQEWTGAPRHIELLEALLSSLQTLSRSGKITFVVALRDDIYKALSPDDPDKLRQSIRVMHWTQKSLKTIIRERIRWATSYTASTAEGFPEIFEEGINLHMLWEVCGDNARRTLSVVDSLITEARREGRSRVTSDILRTVAERMSTEFLHDLDNLHKHTKPGLKFIAQSARKTGKQFSLKDSQELCLDLLVRFENNESGCHRAKWAEQLAHTPGMLMVSLLETEFLLYKSGRDSAPRPYTPNDAVDERTWFAVNPIYALGLGL
ncbi:hypothetical protein HUW62_20350 [Myxococcus sp. AM011]|uniref:P-loop ATPase, Sll1717 family n=1 Tax=Myxococcus sp. AM011 TaxID=2745200 RepID=UPI001595A69A|nr:hypothetical protein [Myxococcus sp. AM011]NVJ23580.1 hypothetical protein [Myxococcus sp. AM011]